MIHAKKFLMCFKQKMENCGLAMYKKGGTNFTEYVTLAVREILEKEFGIHSEKEYFRIDIIGWKDRKKEIENQANQIKMIPHLWDLCIAVEHENAICDWSDELIKLVHIRCPLKVIIGYNHCDCRNENELDKLTAASSWMKKTSAFDPTAKETYLIILGNGSPLFSKDNYTSFDYRGYVYDYETECFVQL